MVALIKNNIASIQDLCRQHHVRSLYLIGSATIDEKFSDNSDIDFLYRFNKDEIPELDYADNFFSLLFMLEELLSRKVDLVSEEKLKNPYFIASINESKQTVYES